MSSFKTNRLIFAIGAMIIGIILLIWPDASLMIIGRCIGAVLAVGGIVAAFLFWKDHAAMSRTLLLIMAAVMLICGVVIILHPDDLVKLIPTIMGILVMMSGLINIGETFLLNRKKYGKWWVSLLVAALKIAAGLFVIRNAFSLAAIITRLAGGVMVFSGGSDLWVLSRLNVAEKKADAQANAPEAGSATAEAMPAETVPVGDVPVGSAPAEHVPVEPAPAEAAPDNTVPAGPALAEPAPAEPAPAEPAPAEPAPVEPALADTAPEAVTEAPAENPESVTPSLVWDDGGVAAGPTDAAEESGHPADGTVGPSDTVNGGTVFAEEVPEYMKQEEQPEEYKIPGEDA